MGEFYAANPVKFEKRKNNVKPMLYYGLAVVAVIIVIFPGFNKGTDSINSFS